MSLIFRRQRTRQPPTQAGIDRGHPLASGLLGFLWVGPGGARELVAPAWTITETGITRSPKRGGVAAVCAGGATDGISSARLEAPQWAPTAASLTYLAYFDHVTKDGVLAGYTSGVDGYNLFDRYGVRRASAVVKIGASTYIAEDAAKTWTNGPTVRGLTVDNTTLRGYDDGAEFANTATGAGSITYNASFARFGLLGLGGDQPGIAGEAYWAALWGRVLSPAEVRDISKNPWLLFAPLPRRIWAPASASGSVAPGAGVLTLAGYAPRADKSVLLSGASVSDITATGATPRVTITY